MLMQRRVRRSTDCASPPAMPDVADLAESYHSDASASSPLWLVYEPMRSQLS